MNSPLLFRFRLIQVLLLALGFGSPNALPAQPPTSPFIAQCELDQDRCHWLVFPTKVGWHYAVEESPDLESFAVATGGNYYGDGTPKRFFLYQDPPPTEGSATPNPPRPAKLVHITLVISNTPGVDRAIAVREATEDSPGWSWELAQAFPQRGMGCFYTKEFPDARWHLWVFAQTKEDAQLPTVPPNQPWGPVSLAEKAAFLESLDQVRGGITQETDVTLPTTPPSADSGQRIFYRVTERGIDTNGNGLYDWWENQYGFNAFYGASDPRAASAIADLDADGRTNLQEQQDGTDPTKADTDGDGVPDGADPAPNDPTVYPIEYLALTSVSVGTGYKTAQFTYGSDANYYQWQEAISFNAVLDWTGEWNGQTAAWDPPIQKIQWLPSSALGIAGYQGAVSAVQFPELPWGRVNTSGNVDAWLTFFHFPNTMTVVETQGVDQFYPPEDKAPPIESAGSAWQRVWATRPYPILIEQTKTFYMLWGHEGQYIPLQGAPIPFTGIDKLEKVTLTIPAGSAVSSLYYDAKPTINNIAHPAWGDGLTRVRVVSSTGARTTTHQADGNIWGSAYANLLPVEIRVRQNNVLGPHGSQPAYFPAKPDDGNVAGELFALWPNEEAFVSLGGVLGDLVDAGGLPENFVQWSGPGLPNKNNEREFRVGWADSGLKVVTLMIGGCEFKIRLNVPDTATMKLNSDELKALVGGAWITAGIYGVLTRNKVAAKYGADGAHGGTKQDAIRHSTWNAVTAQLIGREITLIITTANEHTGRFDQNALASNCTMDLFNNDYGATVGGNLAATGSTIGADDWISVLETAFAAGELRAWTPPEKTVTTHDNILRKSDQTKIFQP